MALEDISPATREEEFLDRIARAAAGPNLPDVDTRDNGKVLTVVSGEWAAATPTAANIPAAPSSSGHYTLMCTVDAQGAASYAWVADLS